MPFPKWSVEPVFLSRKPLPPDKRQELCDFDRTTNLAFANCLRQLASVAKIADRIFLEIAGECRLIGERTERLKEKISTCQSVVDNLNARAVKVPVSDLSETAKRLRTENPYTTKYELSTQLFLPSTRTPCVDSLYQKAYTSPVAVMCTIDHYRTDGLSASELFMVTPVLGGTRKKKRKLLDIETRKPANFSLVKTKQDRIQCGSSSLPAMVSPSMGYMLKQNENLELERLPSPEEQAMLVSLEYPSTVVPIDTSERSFNRMSLLRRSLIHADFVIKRKKSKKKSKRRHTICEGDNREIEKALRNVTNTSCQTDDFLDVSSDSTFIRRPSFLSKRRSRSVQDNSRRKSNILEDSLKNLDSKDSATEEEKEKSKSATIKKSKSLLRPRAFNPISSLQAAISIAAVKMRNSTRKQDDGRSSSGNWSASSSTRASVDSDHQQAISILDGVSSPSRNSVGKDSVLSDITHQDPHNRSKDDILPVLSLTCSPVKQRRYPGGWDIRTSSTPTPDFTSQCSSNTPLVCSPSQGRRGISDDGDSSVYSVDTDGYYTSMHTDSGLWTNEMATLKAEDVLAEMTRFRERQESQSSIDNSSINSFLSKSATECSSNSDSLKKGSTMKLPTPVKEEISSERETQKDVGDSDKSYSPHPQNGSTSESDHEAGDRIRLKTAISANRYPSMCAVSPETSDEESTLSKKGTLPAIANVVVAEVHREDHATHDSKEIKRTDHETSSQRTLNHSLSSNSSVNMYRSETPVPSTFSSNITQSQPVSTSTPRSGINITTFSPDSSDVICPSTTEQKKSNNVSSNSRNSEEIIVSEPPTSPLLKNKSLIPLKYAQRITVTPIARKDSLGGNSQVSGWLNQNSTSDTNSLRKEKPILQNNNRNDGLSTYVSFKAPDSPVSSVSNITPNTSSLQSPNNSLSRNVARVTLDPTGKVIYSSNSLERPTNKNFTKSSDTTPRNYATLPNNSINKHVEQQSTDKCVEPIEFKNNIQPNSSSSIFSLDNRQISEVPNPQNNQNLNLSSFRSNNTKDFNFRPSRGGRFCRSYFPSHLLSANSAPGQQPIPARTGFIRPVSDKQETDSNLSSRLYSRSSTPTHQQLCSESPAQRPRAPSRYSTSNNSYSPASSVPNVQNVDNTSNQTYSKFDPRIWPQRNYYSPIHKKELNSQTAEMDATSNRSNYISITSLSPPDLIPSGESPPSTLDVTSPASSGKTFEVSSSKNPATPMKEDLKSLSANELFTIIHNSKKKHNIKTESEKSMSPLSSRSVSPAFSQSSLSRLQPVETGMFSKRNNFNTNLTEKSKLCNTLPSPTNKRPQEKLASKPTSMRDFKMLLLQTRTCSPSSNSRPSAAELLKVSPPKSSSVSPNNMKSPVVYSSKTTSPHFSSNINYSPGHGTFPTKRAIRTRSPYLSRYDSAYPPIIEDCSEDMESSEENKCLTPNSQSYKTPEFILKQSPPIAKATSTWV